MFMEGMWVARVISDDTPQRDVMHGLVHREVGQDLTWHGSSFLL